MRSIWKTCKDKFLTGAGSWLSYLQIFINKRLTVSVVLTDDLMLSKRGIVIPLIRNSHFKKLFCSQQVFIFSVYEKSLLTINALHFYIQAGIAQLDVEVSLPRLASLNEDQETELKNWVHVICDD